MLFNVFDLEMVFWLVCEKVFKNMNDVVNKNIVWGFFVGMREKKDLKKIWQLMFIGEWYVEYEFN